MFEPALVDFTNQTFQDKEEVIRYIAEMVWENKKIEDKQAYINAVLKREQTASTEMGERYCQGMLCRSVKAGKACCLGSE